MMSFEGGHSLHSRLLLSKLFLGQAEVVVLLDRVGVPSLVCDGLPRLKDAMGRGFLHVGPVFLELTSQDGMAVLVVGLSELSILPQLGLVVVLHFVQDKIFGLSDMDLRFVELPLVVNRRPFSTISLHGQALAIHIF
jgi:hypothetical protein